MNDDDSLEQLFEDLLIAYKGIITGGFSAAMIEQTLREADAAAISGDLPRMIAAYLAMKDHQ